MFEINCLDENNDILYSLTQWDSNRTMKIDLNSYPNISGITEVHFCNSVKEPETAYRVVPTLSNNIASVAIPNKLLQYSKPIYAHVYLVDNDTRKTIAIIVLPVIRRKKPDGYIFSDDAELVDINEVIKNAKNSIATSVTDFLQEHKSEILPVKWTEVLNKPTTFDPSAHTHGNVLSDDGDYEEIYTGQYTNAELHTTTSTSDADCLQAVLKKLCRDYPNKTLAMFKGIYKQNNCGYFEVLIYDTSEVDSTTGLPRYSFGTATKLGAKFYKFGTSEYAYTVTDVDSWRAIQNNLTSTRTVDALSAYQGYLLANGSARDSTKLPLVGGTLTGNLAINSANGVASTDKWDVLTLGNSKAYNTAGHSEGYLSIYGRNYIHTISENGSHPATAGRYHYLPNAGGYLVAAVTTGVGNATKPVYIDGNGEAKACTYTLAQSVTSDSKLTDTNTWRPLGTTADTAAAGNHTHSNYLTSITSAMVTTALGYTPATSNHTHSSYLTGITKAMVTNALGYTPAKIQFTDYYTQDIDLAAGGTATVTSTTTVTPPAGCTTPIGVTRIINVVDSKGVASLTSGLNVYSWGVTNNALSISVRNMLQSSKATGRFLVTVAWA